jgi:hypothetical protein
MKYPAKIGGEKNFRRKVMMMSKTIEEKNKALVLEAIDTLFNQRDYIAAERYFSPKYIQSVIDEVLLKNTYKGITKESRSEL